MGCVQVCAQLARVGPRPAPRGAAAEWDTVASLPAVSAALQLQCDAWDGYLLGMTESTLVGSVKLPGTGGGEMQVQRGMAVAHVFNHGTHHRGQATAALARMGAPLPVLDMPAFAAGGR